MIWKKALGVVLGLQRQESQRAADEQRMRAQLAAEQAASASVQRSTPGDFDAARNTAPAIVRGTPGDTTATLRWTASTDARVRGYRVYFGTASKSYAQGKGAGIDVGNATTYQLQHLKAGATYYFAVTAYDAAAGESDCSSEAAKLIQQVSKKRGR